MSNNNLEEQIADFVVKNKENYYRLAYSYVKNHDDALDIIQESIYKAISSQRSLKKTGSLKAWFYRIVVNTSLDFLRKKRKSVTVGDEIIESLDLETVDSYEDFDLQKALDELPDKYRTVVILRFFEDLKISEIADILDENVNTTKTRLYKSLKMLRIILSDYEED